MDTTEFENKIDQYIESRDLYGRSFTYGVALYEMLRHNALVYDDIQETIDDMLVEHVAQLLDITHEKVQTYFSTGALIEVTDIAMLDEMARSLAGLEEGV